MLGSLLGESPAKTEGALAGAVPAIIGSLVGVASKGDDAANQLTAMVADQDDSVLDNFSSLLASGKHQEIASQGSSMLSSLLGDGMIGGLVGAVSKFSGLGSGSTKSLLGMLAPIVMSVLSREQKAQGLDGGGLVNMLMSQKDNIESAMPAGMASALGGAGLMDSLMGSARSTTSSISESLDTAAGKAGEAAGAAVTASRQAAQHTGAAASRVTESISKRCLQRGDASGCCCYASGGRRYLLDALGITARHSFGVGLAWLQVPGWRASQKRRLDEATDATSSAVETTTDAASDAADAAGDAASSAVESTTESASDAANARW